MRLEDEVLFFYHGCSDVKMTAEKFGLSEGQVTSYLNYRRDKEPEKVLATYRKTKNWLRTAAVHNLNIAQTKHYVRVGSVREQHKIRTKRNR
jgi:hypothetical protein